METTYKIVALFITSVFASQGFWAYMQYKASKKDKRKDDLKTLSQGVMFLLRKDLIERCDKWLDEPHIPMHEWDSIRKENEVYQTLGGNGDVKMRMALMEDKIRTDLKA